MTSTANLQANRRQLYQLSRGKISRIGKNVSQGRCANGEAMNTFLRMLARAEKGKCLVWPFGKSGQMGYGCLHVGTRKVYTHHLAWQKTFGRIPKGKHVLHHCDNPPCFNPFDLFLGTPQDNATDAISKGRTDYKKGTKNPSHKLTESEVREIRFLYRKGILGHGQIALADRFGITRIAVRKIVRRETWAWLS